MGYALQEEESGNYPFLIFLERSSNWGLLPLLEELAKSPRVSSFFLNAISEAMSYNFLSPLRLSHNVI